LLKFYSKISERAKPDGKMSDISFGAYYAVFLLVKSSKTIIKKSNTALRSLVGQVQLSIIPTIFLQVWTIFLLFG